MRHALPLLFCIICLALPQTASASMQLWSGIVVWVKEDKTQAGIRITNNIESSGDYDVGSVQRIDWSKSGAVFVLDGRRVPASVLLRKGQHILAYPKDDGFFFGTSTERSYTHGFIVELADDRSTLTLQLAAGDPESREVITVSADGRIIVDGEAANAAALQPNAELAVTPARPQTIEVDSQPHTLPPLTEEHANSAGGRLQSADKENITITTHSGADHSWLHTHKTWGMVDTQRAPDARVFEPGALVYGWCTRGREAPNFLVRISEPDAQVTGTITAVGDGSLTVQTPTGEQTVAIASDAGIELDGEGASASALQTGRPVRVLTARPQILRATSCPVTATDATGLLAAARDGDAATRAAALRMSLRRGLPLADTLSLVEAVSDDFSPAVVEAVLWAVSRYPEETLREQAPKVCELLQPFLANGEIQNIKGEGYLSTGELGGARHYVGDLVRKLGPTAKPLKPALLALAEAIGGGKGRGLRKSIGKHVDGE